jgi:hypothetical protein
MSEITATADNTSERTARAPPATDDPARTEPEPAGFDDGEFDPCVPPPAPHVHLCKLVNLPDLWWELLYEHPGFMCEFCERLENAEYSPDESDIVGVFCESCRIKIARLPANRCLGSAPDCLSVRWVGPLGELSDFCRACARAAAAPKKHPDEKLRAREQSFGGPQPPGPPPRRRGKRGGRKVRARKEKQQQARPEETETEIDHGATVGPGHASRPYGLEIQLGKMPGLRVVEPEAAPQPR